MKKALIALLSLAVAGVLVAQDAPSLKFSGSLQTGVAYDMGDDVEDPVLSNYAEDAGAADYRLRLQGLYENGDAGLKFRLSSNGAAPAVTTDFAWGWVNLFDGMALVSSGYKIDNNSWRTTGDGEFDYEGTGLKVEVKPMDGLNLGFGVFANGTELDVTPYVLGVKYDVAPITFAAGAKLVEELQSVYAGVTYAGVENVSLSFEGKVDVIDLSATFPGLVEAPAGLSDYSDFGRTTLVQTVSYTKDALEAGVKAYEFLYGDSDIDMGLKITPWVAYTMDKNTFKLEVTYNNDEYEIDELAGIMVEDEYSTLTLKPTVTTKFTDKAKLVTGYKYVAMTDMEFDNSQQFFLNFIFEF